MMAAFEAAYRAALLVPDAGQAGDRGGGVGGAGRGIGSQASRRNEPAPAQPPRRQPSASPAPASASSGSPAQASQAGPGPDVHRRRVGRGGPACRAAGLRPGPRGHRARAHHRGLRHHRGRAGLAGRGDRPGGPAADPARRPPGRAGSASTDADPVMLEIFNNLFMSVAEQMGVRLQSTAHSVNIKERLDFSCAIFDAAGQLIANAPHMPVHLGSMGESIKMVLSRNRGAMKPGDVFMLNDPYHGGTHLPDITVVTPVFREGCSGRVSPGRRSRRRRPGHPVLRGLPGASRRDRRHHARLDAGLQHPGRRGRRADRQLAPRRRRRDARGRHHGPAHLGGVPVPQPGRQPGRPAGPDRGEREGRGRAAGAGQPVRAGRGDRVHGSRAGQRRRGGTPGPRRAGGRRVRLRAGQRGRDQGRGAGGPGRPGPPRSTSPAPLPSRRGTSTPRPRWPWPRSCTCCAPWWTTRSR